MAGFTLIELMVALVAGLIVTGAALAFTMSSLRANSEYISSTRLTQELRSNLNFISDELRRAGYDESAIDYVGRPPAFGQFTPFSTMLIDADLDGDGNAAGGTLDGCVIFAYDRLPGDQGQVDLENGEIRAFRLASRDVNSRQVGVLEFAESDTGLTPACDGDSPDYTTYPATCTADGWCAVSDPRVIDLTAFALDTSGITDLTNPSMQIRRLGVDLRGRLVNSTETDRGVRSNVRIRADCVRAAVNVNCTQAPSGT